jgi:hypothetical protein
MEILTKLHERVQASDQRAIEYNKSHSSFRKPWEQLQQVSSPFDAARVHAARVFNAVDYTARRLIHFNEEVHSYTENPHDVRRDPIGRAGQEQTMNYLAGFVGVAELIGGVAAAGWFVAVLTTRLAEEGLVKATHSSSQGQQK